MSDDTPGDEPEASQPARQPGPEHDPDATQRAEPVAGGLRPTGLGDDPDATEASPAATPWGDPEATQPSTDAVIPGPGYEPTVMIGSATSVFDTPAGPSGAVAPPLAGATRPDTRRPPDRGRQALIAVLALLIVAVAGFGAWLLTAGDDDGPPATTPSSELTTTTAVPSTTAASQPGTPPPTQVPSTTPSTVPPASTTVPSTTIPTTTTPTTAPTPTSPTSTTNSTATSPAP